MKKKMIIIISIIVAILLIILALILFINPKDTKSKITNNFKYYNDDNNYALYLEKAKVNETIKYVITDNYTIELKFTDLKGEVLSYDIYVNNLKLTSTKMVDFTNSEFDVEDFYLYGNTLVYFSDNTYNKDDLNMYFINDNKITGLPTVIKDKDLTLSGYIANKDHITVEYSRMYENDEFIYQGKKYNLCKKLPEGMNDETLMQEFYNLELKENRLSQDLKFYSKYNYEEFKKETDIVCE